MGNIGNPEISYPAAFVYDQPGKIRCISYQVIKDEDPKSKLISGANPVKLRERLNKEEIKISTILFLTRDQIVKLNLIPLDFIRPFNPEEKRVLNNS
jgi:hypothetical protein